MALNSTSCCLAQVLQPTQPHDFLLIFCNTSFVPKNLEQTKELTLKDSLPIFPEFGIYILGQPYFMLIDRYLIRAQLQAFCIVFISLA